MNEKNAAAKEHLGLVHACCKRFKDRGIEYEELFAAGCLGLSKALSRFDESRGLKFSTYAFPVITGEIKQLFRDSGAVRVSRSLKELSLRAQRESERFAREHGREPSVSELSSVLKVGCEETAAALESSRVPLSLSPDEKNAPPDIPVPDIGEEIAERLSLEAALKSLEPDERRLIELRYFQSKTQAQTAGLMNTSQVQISRREKKILALIRLKMSG